MDCICCGFGATILLYMILNSGASRAGPTTSSDPLRAETNRLEQQVLEGQANLVELRNTFDAVRQDSVTTAGPVHAPHRRGEAVAGGAGHLRGARRSRSASTSTSCRPTCARWRRGPSGSPAGLQSREVPGRQGALLRRRRRPPVPDRPQGRRQAHPVPGGRARPACSRTRSSTRCAGASCPRPTAIRADKWRRAVRAVDWLTTQIPRDVAVPDLRVRHRRRAPSCPGPKGRGWRRATGTSLDRAVVNLRGTAPQGGTSLESAFAAAAALQPAARQHPPPHRRPAHPGPAPRPAAAHGLRQGAPAALRARHRRRCPGGVPVNTLLFPMEGDPMAAPAFWKLAMATRRLVHDSVAGLAVKRAAARPRPLQPVVPRLHLLRLRGHHPAPHPHPHERAAGHRGRRSEDLAGPHRPAGARALRDPRRDDAAGARAAWASASSSPPSGWRWPGCRATSSSLRGRVQGQPRAVAGAGHHGRAACSPPSSSSPRR